MIGAAAVGLAVGLLVGWLAYLRLRRRWIAAAAVEAVEVLRARRIAEDREAGMPPTVRYSEALDLATRWGVPVAEAAEALFATRAHAYLAEHGRREVRRLRRAGIG